MSTAKDGTDYTCLVNDLVKLEALLFASSALKNLCIGTSDEPNERLMMLAGMVSMLPTVDNSLFKIDGGNAQVPEHLLQHAMVQMCNASVTEIVKLDSGRYQLKAHGTDAQQV